MIVIAVASGTSADGLDVGVVDVTFDDAGDLELAVLDARTEAWQPGHREAVLAMLPPAATSAAEVCALDQALGQATADAVSAMSDRIAPRSAELVVAPGQTVFHDVRDGTCHGTLQLGQPAWVAERTGLPVISDLRARDVAAGGQGAPLVSILDSLWLHGSPGPVAALNLGGIANVSIVGAAETPVLAWDTGPANCLLDVAAAQVTQGQQAFDRDGEIARSGVVRPDLLARLLRHPHFSRRPPVSTGRETFSGEFVDAALRSLPPVSAGDLLATLTELTAVSVAQAIAPYDVREVVASGGGTRNAALMAALRRRLASTPLVTSDDRGLPAQAKEVVMWALLGFLTWHGLPATTGATGAVGPRVLGRISPGVGPLRLPSPAGRPVRRLRVAAPVVGRPS